MNGFERSLSILIAYMAIHDGGGVFNNPRHEWMVGGNSGTNVAFQSGFVGTDHVFNFLYCVLGLTIRLRFAHCGSLRHHLRELVIEELALSSGGPEGFLEKRTKRKPLVAFVHNL